MVTITKKKNKVVRGYEVLGKELIVLQKETLPRDCAEVELEACRAALQLSKGNVYSNPETRRTSVS